MAELLRRSLAPLTDEAWKEVDEAATRALRSQLSARAVVDFDGPHGWECAAVNLGRLSPPKKDDANKVPWCLREVQPLIETRMGCTLDQWELDNVSRGCSDPDLEELENAARAVALFEETAIYHGFAKGQIKGILPSCKHKPIRLPSGVDKYPAAVADAVKQLDLAGIGGPYALVLGTDAFYPLMQSGSGGYPPRRIVREMLGQDVLWSPALKGGVLLSTRGGDFVLTVGQDVSVGYAANNREKVELFLTESFTFRVLEPAAAIELKLG